MHPEHLPETRVLWHGTEGVGIDEQCDTLTALEAYLDSQPGFSRVAIDEAGRVIGAVLCGHDGRRGYLHHLAVAQECRGKGIGRALVESCLERLGDAGLVKCNVFVFDNNVSAKRFWQGGGWNMRPDLLVMQKPTRGGVSRGGAGTLEAE